MCEVDYSHSGADPEDNSFHGAHVGVSGSEIRQQSDDIAELTSAPCSWGHRRTLGSTAI